MKKLIGVFIIYFFTTNLQAQVTDSVIKNNKSSNSKNNTSQGPTKYIFYPEENIYFNEANAQYTYYDPATSMWTSNSKLPPGYLINNKTPKSTVIYNGTDVWKKNATHQQNYKTENNKPSKP